jgi:hypothetical protein
MQRNFAIKPHLLLFILLYVFLLYFFYITYVPLIGPFQLVLVPVLLLAFVLTFLDIHRGLLYFIFVFPLINNWPYFFGIHEHIPHAPAALVLFLFFFLGWLGHKSIFKSDHLSDFSIQKPILVFSFLILISGLITFSRYTNFFPFLSDQIYELITNANGVTAGGALMSTVFFSLNYLSGFCLFLIFVQSVKSEEFVKKAVIVLLMGTSISILFGWYQNFVDLSFGNTPMRVSMDMVNSTFKDSHSFGAYLTMVLPLLLGTIFLFKRKARVIPLLLVFGALYILPTSGSKSSYIAMVISLVLFGIFSIKMVPKKHQFFPKKNTVIYVLIGLVAIAALVAVLVLSKESKTFQRFEQTKTFFEKGRIARVLSKRWTYRWKVAAHMIRDYSLTGIGMGGFIIESSNVAEMKGIPHQKITSESAENYFLQVGSELGVGGLILVLWIFWEILKRIKGSLGKDRRSDKWKYIQLGLSCGILGQMIIFMVHTFIGSYEIKYMFWLCVGMLFVLSREEKTAAGRMAFSQRFKIAFGCLMIIFAVVFLWNSTHSLSLRSRTRDVPLTQDFGLTQLETTEDGRVFQWTRSYGGVSVTVEKPRMKIPILASHPDIDVYPVKVRIFIIKDLFREMILLDELTIRERLWKTYEYSIPDELDKDIILLFKVSRTWNPLKTLGTPDPRNLGIALEEIEFVNPDSKEFLPYGF